MTEQVIDNREHRRFELPLEGFGLAFIDYTLRPDGVRVLTHAEVPMQLRGGGVGVALTRGALELVRSRGEQVVPRCPYIVHFISRHPEYADLVSS